MNDKGTLVQSPYFIFGALDIGDGVVDQFAQGALSSAVSQGLGVATGLQSKLDWVGVAAAGVAQAAGSYAGAQLPNLDISPNGPGGLLLTGTARLLANAAVRTLVSGTDFGDNIIAALPDTIGQTIGNAVASAETPTNGGLSAYDQAINSEEPEGYYDENYPPPSENVEPTYYADDQYPPPNASTDAEASAIVAGSSNGDDTSNIPIPIPRPPQPGDVANTGDVGNTTDQTDSSQIETVVVTGTKSPLSSYPLLVQQILSSPKSTKWTVKANFANPVDVGSLAAPKPAVHIGFVIYKDGQFFAGIDAGPSALAEPSYGADASDVLGNLGTQILNALGLSQQDPNALGNLIFDRQSTGGTTPTQPGLSQLTLSPPPGVDGATFAANLITAAYGYDGSLPYSLPPPYYSGVYPDPSGISSDTMAPGTYNSNSFAAAVLNEIGASNDVNVIQTYLLKNGFAAPGIEQPVPANHFK